VSPLRNMKILLVGMGSIGARRYHALKKLKDEYGITFLCFRTNLNRDNTRTFDDIEYFDDLDRALAARPACCVISNPTSLHIKTAIACARTGASLFIEKPLSHNLHGVRDLLSIVDRLSLITHIGCDLRFHPGLTDVKEIVESSRYGKAYDFDISCGSYLPEWRSWQDYRQSYSARKALGGGVVLDLIHEIDYAYWLFGDFVSVKSLVGYQSNLGIETEDVAKIIAKTSGDIFGSISLNYYQRPAERKLKIVCERATVRLDMINNSLSVEGPSDGYVNNYSIQSGSLHDMQMTYFMDCVANNRRSNNDIGEGLKVLEYALKIKKAGY
jgi:predicted dehydrogenase